MKITFFKRSIFCGGAVLVSLSGCGKKSESAINEHSIVSIVTTNLVTTTLNSTSECFSTTSYTSLTNLPYTTSFSNITTDYNITTCTITDIDYEILDFFDKMGDIVKDSFDSGELLDKGKSYFIYCVDFLFFDGEIKGVKFDDLTDSAKQQLLSDISTIDSLICSKYPDYKEDIKDGYGIAFNKASEVISVGSNNIKDFSKDKLGEDNYNKLKEYNNLFMDTAFGDFDEFVGILSGGKQKVIDWYKGLQ